MEAFFILVVIGAIGWGIWYGLFGRFEAAAQEPPPPPLPERRSFDVIRDARGNSTMFGFPVIFSSRLDTDKHPNVVTGLTLNRDYVAVRRGSYGVKAFLLDKSLTVGVMNGCPPGFHENTEYMMELESETELARFPVSFPGWLQVVDAARRGGSTIEVDSDLPAHLKDLIETPLPGDEAIKPVRTKARGAKQEASRETGRCASCGASIGRKSTCDYCGGSQ